MSCYTTALTLLSRRELSAKQLRERLARRKFDVEDINTTLDRLITDGTVDDRRVALAYARMEAAVKGRGRRRVVQAIQRLGVSADTAEGAVAEVFGELDENALLTRALEKRLKGRAIDDLDAHARARLVRQLVAQGFSVANVLRVLRG